MRERGATLLETAIIIPILIAFVFGLVEFGRYVALTSTVTNASREAARYAVATGIGTGTGPRYADCDGMREAAGKFGVVAQLSDGQVTLDYDKGPSSSVFLSCEGSSVDPGSIKTGDRIVATVSVPFRTTAPFFDSLIGPQTVSVQTTRTINKG